MNSGIITLLLITHLVGDFYLQTNQTCSEKNTKHILSKHLWLHSLAIAILSWLAVGSWSFLWCTLVLFFSHVLIDVIKTYLRDNINWFVIDQLMHIAVIITVAGFFAGCGYGTELAAYQIGSINVAMLLLVIIFLLKVHPTNA
jgi:hypothetical protein